MNDDVRWMNRALQLARLGEGFVEPNPMVGCVLVRDGIPIGQGYHTRYGGPHAEVEALQNAPDGAAGATCYVTLEPCSHYGKTPPCADALIEAGIRRVVVGMRDPNPVVNGRGLERLRDAGIEITENVLEDEARALTAPFRTRLDKRRPWIVAKWAMTLDGRLASRSGSSRWISGAASRAIVHRLRSRMDAILVGSGTQRCDDPQLTVWLDDPASSTIPGDRPGPRKPIRIVLDSKAQTDPRSRLVRTASETPVWIVVDPGAAPERVERLRNAGCEIVPADRSDEGFDGFLAGLAERGMTNLLVEGGSRIFGMLLDRRRIDEVHAFVASKLIGGADAVPVIGGMGQTDMERALNLKSPEIHLVGTDVYVRGRTEN